MPRVYDTFMFRDELDILECRLTELEDCDVTHVLVEATISHQGKPKPLVYADHKSRFARWNDRIIHVEVRDLPGRGDWDREEAQRELARRGLKDAAADDVVINSDCDEILTANAIKAAHELDTPGWRLLLRKFIYACDWEVPGGEIWNKPVMARYGDIRDFTVLRHRSTFSVTPPEMGPMGWHFSFFGGPDGIMRKLDADCHAEIRDQHREYVAAGRCWERGEFPFDVRHADPVDVDDTWPRYVREGRAPAVWFRPR